MRLLVALALGVGMVSVGCAGLGPHPLPGNLYSDYHYPGYYNDADANGPGPKTGTAMAKSILGLVSLGDASIKAACEQGGVQTVHTIDHHIKNILGVYAEWTTIVTGD